MGDRVARFHFGGRRGACGVASMWEKERSIRALNQIVFLSLSFSLLLKLFCFLLHVWRDDVLRVAAMFVCLFECCVLCVWYTPEREGGDCVILWCI